MKPLNLKIHKHLLVKLLVGFLLIGLAFRLLFIRSSDIPSRIETPFSQETHFPEKTSDSDTTLVPLDAQENEEQIPQNTVELQGGDDEEEERPKNEVEGNEEQRPQIGPLDSGDVEGSEQEKPQTGKCDIFTGDWVADESGPMYTNQSCPLIESHQNCMRNGRPDTGYLYWRWRPRDCELPRFDPKRFLELMKNKRWALVGDSISRNHVQSLLCMLSTVEQPIHVYHDKDYKSRRWHFRSYNLTIDIIFSPYLVKAAIFEDSNGVSSSEVKLYLDKLDKQWTDLYPKFDYMIISTGKWFLKSMIFHENDEVVGCHKCHSDRNLTELGFDFAYRKVLRIVLNFVAESDHKMGSVLFRTSTPDHFEDGEWSTGGTCKRSTPVKGGVFELKPLSKVLRDIELEEFEKVKEKAESNGVNLRLLDVSGLSLLRPDGHPGPYREFNPFAKGKNVKVQYDCLHWCLPGPIDSWNELIMETVVNG